MSRDQASRLRTMAQGQPTESPLFAARVVAITSGKGGVGKTNVVAGLALALAQQGQRVVVMDADFGLANLDILLGLSPKYTLEHVLRGEKVIEEILLGVDDLRAEIPDQLDVSHAAARAKLHVEPRAQRAAKQTQQQHRHHERH